MFWLCSYVYNARMFLVFSSPISVWFTLTAEYYVSRTALHWFSALYTRFIFQKRIDVDVFTTLKSNLMSSIMYIHDDPNGIRSICPVTIKLWYKFTFEMDVFFIMYRPYLPVHNNATYPNV